MYTPEEVRGFQEVMTAFSFVGCDTDELSPDARRVLRFILYRADQIRENKVYKRLQQELPWKQRQILVGIIPLLTGNRSSKNTQLELERYDTLGKMGNEARLDSQKSRMREKLMLRQQAVKENADPQAEADKAKAEARKARAKAKKAKAKAQKSNAE